MKYMEFIDSTFFAFCVKSRLLLELLGENYLFNIDDDYLKFGFAVKGDSFIGEDEEYISYGSLLPYESPKIEDKFDFCKYLISLFEKHSTCGLIDGFYWREGLRCYDAEENVNYGSLPLYDEILESQEIQEILAVLKDNYDEINNSIEEFFIFEYNFMGEYGESKLELFFLKNGDYSRETLDEDEVSDLMGCDSFNDEVLYDDNDLESLLIALLDKYM